MGNSVHMWIIYSVLVATVTTSAIFDYKSHRIPNWLSFSGWYLGPILHQLAAGLPGLSDSLAGLMVVLALTFPLFAVKWMGAGDVKLMTSVGALAGIEHALMFLVSIIFTGLLLGIVQIAAKGVLSSYMRRYCAMFGMSIVSCRPVYMAPDSAREVVIMPYAVSVAIGSLLALWLI